MADEGWAAPGTAGGQGPFGEWTGAPGQDWAGPYAPPPPPPRGGVRLRVVLGLLAIVALVAVTVAGALVLSSGDGDSDGDSVEPAEPVDANLVPFTDPQGAYEISVPEGWVSASLEGDVSGIGQEAFPDDPDMAAELQRRLTSVPRAVVFLSLDRDQMGIGQLTRNFTLIRLPGAGGGDQDDLVAEARQAIGAGVEVTDEGSFLAAGREGVRLEYEVSGTIAGVAYFLDAGGDVWALTYTSIDLPEEEPLADEVAATLVPGA
jgi:hypothetical protein